jgi:hypothetical protein
VEGVGSSTCICITAAAAMIVILLLLFVTHLELFQSQFMYEYYQIIPFRLTDVIDDDGWQ